MNRAKELIVAFIAHLGFSLLGFCMTNATKRYVLLVSLQVHLVREGILQEETMSKLNAMLDLVKYEEALELPVLLHKSIWGRVDVSNILQSSDMVDLIHHCPTYPELRRISDAIVRHTPTWLQYGNGADYMQHDIIRLLSCQPELHSVTVH